MINSLTKTFTTYVRYSHKTPQPLRSKKIKSTKNAAQKFLDSKYLRAVGGHGGNGCISFLSLWKNEFAGPDGGDGGHGGHVMLQATHTVRDLKNVPLVLKAENGENGYNKDCQGKNANHLIIPVPIGTVIKNKDGRVIGDLAKDGAMFLAARGGAGGKGNRYFANDTVQKPTICEYGANGEDLEYFIEIKSMAHVGLVGLPNAGKSSLLRAISRACPKVAPYPFTTLQPHIGMVLYDDYEQIADLPGLIPNSHKDRGLGIQFLKHAERCAVLLFVLDMSLDEPWESLKILQNELVQFSTTLASRSQLIVANKMDLKNSEENLKELKHNTDLEILPISAKTGQNLVALLTKIRLVYNKSVENS